MTYPDGGGSPSRLLDVTQVRATYDSATGKIDLAFDGDSLSYNDGLYSSVSFYASIAAPNPRTGRCDGTLADGDFRISAYGSQYYGSVSTSASLSNATGMLVAQGTLAWPGNGASPRITFQTPSLERRDYRCLYQVQAQRYTSGFQAGSTDDVADFCLAGCPEGQVVPQSDPPAPGNVRASNGTLTWSAVAGADSYILATSNAPEGAAGRTTAYRTIYGLSTSPPAVPGSTVYYGVRANLPKARWSTPEVGVAYAATGVPSPAPVIPLPVPVVPAPAPVVLPAPAPVVAAPTPVAAPVVAQPQAPVAVAGAAPSSQLPSTTIAKPVLTSVRSKSVTQTALTSRFGTAFVKRVKRSYKVACTQPKNAVATCRVQWRYKRFTYKGQVIVTRTPAGDRWRSKVKRSVSRTS